MLRHSLFPACLGDLIPNSRALFSWSLGKVLCLWFSPFSLPRSSLWPFCCSVTLAPVLHLIESKTTLSPSCGPLGCGLLSQPELGGVSGPPSPVSSAQGSVTSPRRRSARPASCSPPARPSPPCSGQEGGLQGLETLTRAWDSEQAHLPCPLFNPSLQPAGQDWIRFYSLSLMN